MFAISVLALLPQPPLAVLRGRTVRPFLFAVALSSLAPLPFPRAAKAQLENFLKLDDLFILLLFIITQNTGN